MIRVEVDANPFREGADPFPNPVVYARDAASAPRMISRLGADKATFLCEGIAQKDALRRGEILELFGGSSLSTAALCQVVRGAERVVAGDLRYAIGAGRQWAYACQENFDRACDAWKRVFATGPRFAALDAVRTPFPSEAFAAVLMPDSPRDAAERFRSHDGAGAARLSGSESGLDYASQKKLFLAAVEEARRVLRAGGVLAGTAPRSWTREVDPRRWTRWQALSSERLDDDVTVLAIGRRLRFNARDSLDPVVYFRGVR